MATLEDLTTPLSVDDVRTSIYNVLAALGVNTTGWKPGAVTRAIITVVATVFAAFTELTSAIARAGFLELSTGDWLTITARYLYGVERQAATFASGTVTLDNSGGGVYSFAPGDLIVVNSTTGKTYRNTASVTLNAVTFGVSVLVEAIEAGTASNANPGQINALESSLTGVTVTNPLAIVGVDAETDLALRARCLEKLQALSPNGPKDAYAYFAKTATRQADGSLIGVTRVRTLVNSSTGNVTTVCATATGAIPGTAGDAASDLGAVNQAIQLNVVPIGVTATVQSAVPLVVPVTYEVWIYATSGMTTAQIQTTIATAISNFVSSVPIGGDNFDTVSATGRLYVAGLRAAIVNSIPQIFNALVTLPASDVTVAYNEVAQLGAVTTTAIHQVAP